MAKAKVVKRTLTGGNQTAAGRLLFQFTAFATIVFTLASFNLPLPSLTVVMGVLCLYIAIRGGFVWGR